MEGAGERVTGAGGTSPSPPDPGAPASPPGGWRSAVERREREDSPSSPRVGFAPSDMAHAMSVGYLLQLPASTEGKHL